MSKFPSLYEYAQLEYKLNRRQYFQKSKHYELICDKLEKVFLGKIDNLIITVPPRSGKSDILALQFPSWAFSLFPDSEFIYTGYSARLVIQFSHQTRDIMQSSFYKSMFPHVSIKSDSKARDNWRTTAGGCFYAVGIGGTTTGKGAGKRRDGFGGAIIIDDPLNAKEYASEVIRENVLEWFKSTLVTRKNNPKTPMILIMQRLHEEDLAGWLLEGNDGRNWEHVNIPAIKDGKSFCEKIYPIEDLLRERQYNPYNFSAQFMQEPSPADGAIFKAEWWRYYDELPKLDFGVISVDTAQKTKEHNDYTVFQCWGYADNKAYLVDQVRIKIEVPDLKPTFMNFYNKCKEIVHIQITLIEDKVSGTGLIQSLRRDSDSRINIRAIQRHIDKVTRALDIVPKVASGCIYIPRSAPYIEAFVLEFSRFTPAMTHKHDDQIDAAGDGLTYIFENIRGVLL